MTDKLKPLLISLLDALSDPDNLSAELCESLREDVWNMMGAITNHTLVPDSTTSAQKFYVNGEFYVDIEIACNECTDLGKVEDDCYLCEGEGMLTQKSVIPWTTCKDIYYAMLKVAKESSND